jgi:hypothetical protein
LQERLPADLIAGPEEEVVTVGARGQATQYRPDLQVREPVELEEPAVAEVSTPPATCRATEPIRMWSWNSNR